MRPWPDHWRAFTLVVRDLLKEEQKRARSAEELTRRRITELQTKLSRLEEAFIFDRRIDQESYQQHRAALREELALARMEHHRSSIEALDIEGTLSFAEHTMTNASTLWTAAADVETIRLQWALFPSGITWGDGNTFTAVNCLEFFELADLQNGWIQVGQTGIESVTSLMPC